MNPYVISSAVVALLIAFSGAYLKGHHDAAVNCEVQRAADRAKGQELKDKEAKTASVQSTKVEEHHAEREIVYRNITREVEKVVERPVYRSVCFDDDGLRAANRALAGSGTAAGQPNVVVPAALPAR